MDSILEQQHYEEKKEYGGFWIRFAAYLIDSIIVVIPLGILSTIIFVIFFGASGAFDAAMNDPNYLEQDLTDAEAVAIFGGYLVAIFVNFAVAVLYFAGLHASKWQATIGKKLLGLKVTDMDGNRISFWRAFGRYLAMTFLSSIFMIGYIIAAFTEKKQALHDLIARTIVVKQ
ncbi:RDD family protein [Bacillus methanolicus]|uniref:YxaI n=1 Tax=Bacillus methanolicus (strain MGA3 / ATCC 53907) TaxID=796606 RepID=I3DYR8_BACMM|nr:RDD family protein [Bacillus methanolicus]AIE59465.1 YxaI [Bacillus methanolicus MGA3]EIJ79389.1 RDD family protein [Bacillus methanolicus MGA3]